MKVNHNDLVSHIQAIDQAVSILATILESKNSKEWSVIPSSDLLIVEERLKLINSAIKDIYEVIDNYEN